MKITKKPPSYLDLIEELNETYGEWIEMGHSVESILLSLLHKEREKNYDLMMKIEYMEKR
jgi:DNA-binding PadR family transcriptional regulator